MTEAADSSVSLGDGPCMRCGYNLRGLTAESRCPECGTAAKESIAYNTLDGVHARWFSAVRLGMLFFGTVFLVGAMGDALILAMSYLIVGGVFASLLMISGNVIQLCAQLSIWWGAQLITEKRTTVHGLALEGRRERTARLASNVLAAYWILHWGYLHFIVPEILGFLRAPTTGLAMEILLGGVYSGLIIWYWWAMLEVVAAVATVVNRKTLAKQAKVFRWVVVGWVLIQYVLGLVLSLLIDMGYRRIGWINPLASAIMIAMWAAIIWIMVVMVQLYISLGRDRANAPTNPLNSRSPWIPEVAVTIANGLKKAWTMARYSGQDGN